MGVVGWKTISNFGPLQKEIQKSLEEMILLVESTLHPKAYTREEICDLLKLSNDQELFDICQISDHVRNCQSFELYKRAMHVFGEAKRVYDFKRTCDEHLVAKETSNAVAEDENPLVTLGKLMFASHESCDQMYDCSHPQLNTLVDLSKKHGALGAR